MADASRFTISELAEAADTTPRTVRFYTAEGLLPPPDSRGRFALYSTEHLDRLLLINRLKQAFQPLGAIRDRMERLTAEDIRSLLSEAGKRSPSESLNDLLLKSAELIRERSTMAEQTVDSTRSSAIVRENRSVRSETRRTYNVTTRAEIRDGRGTETWQRFYLAPGLELNVKGPITDENQQRVAALLRHAAELFDTCE